MQSPILLDVIETEDLLLFLCERSGKDAFLDEVTCLGNSYVLEVCASNCPRLDHAEGVFARNCIDLAIIPILLVMDENIWIEMPETI